MKAIILSIGDELLIGQVVNTNATWLGEQLHETGIEVKEIITIKDELQPIQEAIDHSLSRAPLVIMTGGLGPTKDDITKKAISRYFKVPLKFDENTFQRIEKLFKKSGSEPTPSHKEQCFMPANAELLRNNMGTAPGMWMESGDKVVVSLPGVPYEMKWIFENGLKQKIQRKFNTKTIYFKTILTVPYASNKRDIRVPRRISGLGGFNKKS